jgi:hypothetical protein
MEKFPVTTNEKEEAKEELSKSFATKKKRMEKNFYYWYTVC